MVERQANEAFITVYLTPRDASELSALADRLADRESIEPYLTREQLFDTIDLLPDEKAMVLAWAHSQGLELTPAQAEHPLVLFLGSSREEFAQAFGERALHWLANPRSDRPRRLNWPIPPRVAGYVQGVQVLRDIEHGRNWLEGNCFISAATTERHGMQAEQGDGPPRMPHRLGGMSPDDIASIYDFPTEWDGSGETIAILLLDAAPNKTECDAFWRAHGIKRELPQVVYVGPPPDDVPDSAEALEAAMAVQWAGAMAPGARIVCYVMDRHLIADKWSAFLMAVIADNDWRPTIATTSWLIPERDYYAAYGSRVITSLLDQCAALGITVISAAGDWGAYDGIPRTMTRGARVSDATWPRAVFPAVEERVLGVGGTMVTHREPLTEVTWSGPLPPGFATDAPVTRLASGGGFSAEVPIPDWQEHFLVFNESERIYRTYSRGPNAPAVMAYGRGVPDVSIMAVADAVQRSPTEPLTARGYRALVNGRWIDFAGGTSTGAPIWAALLARINQACQAAGLRRVGFVNPLLYHLVRYADEYNRKPYLREEDKLPKPFRDIISGRSDVTLRALDGACMPVQVELPGFEATGSWDPATGLGVPIGTRLLDAIVAHGHDLRRRAAEAAAVGEGEGR